MNRYKCKGCKWYNKPYWSIISPCENCPRDEINVEIITRWIDPTIEEKDKEIERLNNIINTLEDILINKIRQIDERIKKDKIKPYGIEFELNECAKNRYREMLDKIKELKGVGKE